MVLDFRKLQQRLEKAAPGSVYLLVGEETYLHQEAVNLFKNKVVDPGTADFNCDVFDVGSVTSAHVRDAAEMLPMMSPQRLVIYRGVDRLADKDWEVLLPIIENPVDSTVFILCGESVDKRKKHYKKIAEKAVIVELNPPYENQLGEWLDYLAFQLGLRLSREAAQLIAQFVGTSLTEIHNELVKMRDYLGARTQVEAPDVLAVVTHSRVDRIFDFTDAIGRKDKVNALNSLANLLEHGQNEVGVVAMLARHFRILRQIQDGMKKGLSGARLCSRAGIPPFLLKPYLGQVRNWDESKIRSAFVVLQDTDRALKSSSIPAHVWLENFVLKTCG